MIKIKGITDLVSVATINRLSQKIVNSARGFARMKGIAKVAKVKQGVARVTQNTVTLDITTTKAGMAFEKGSGLHDPKSPHFIEIVPKSKPHLIFEGTNDFAGELIVTDHVNHPGVKPRPFIQPAREKHREEMKRVLKEEVGKNIRLAIRGMARRV